MSIPYEKALALLIQKNENLSFEPVIVDVEFDGGGDYQIGDMTWDHDNASITVKYRDPAQTPGKTFRYWIDLEYYNVVPFDQEQVGRSGFAGLMDDLLNIAITQGAPDEGE